ncbi:MAG: signal peptide peptidase SppA [Alphaproteobacteria bacterium]|nr:signal peptide peptidase SppA [Alphaproteobacteria bacterium]MDD9920021.1 signal peptide peptidase SppA [Alphaproteobacteria bacterium]
MNDMTHQFLHFIRLERGMRRWRMVAIFSVIALIVVAWGGHFSASSSAMLHSAEQAHIARISVEGMILEDDYANDILADIAADKHVKGAIVTIDSPGGTMVGGLSLYRGLRRISEAGKPVTVVMKTVAASGGYLAAIGADHIFANEGTLTGSIGVILPSVDVTELADKVGVASNDVVSGDLKAVTNPLQPRTAKAQAYLQEVVNELNEVFYRYVVERRALADDVVAKVKDGRVVVGTQAVEMGLVDALGDMFDAKKWLVKKAALADNIPVLDYALEEPRPWLQRALEGSVSVGVGALLQELGVAVKQTGALAVLR